MTLNCFKCKQEIVFDNEHIGQNGKKIPLDPFTKQPHDCPMREKSSRGVDENANTLTTNHFLEQKNDHGNELVQQMDNVRKRAPDLFEALAKDDPSYIVDSNHDKKYVDHTVAKPSKVKIFHAENSDLVELAYNEFLKSKTFQWTRAQLGAKGNEFAIALYYEETN